MINTICHRRDLTTSLTARTHTLRSKSSLSKDVALRAKDKQADKTTKIVDIDYQAGGTLLSSTMNAC